MSFDRYEVHVPFEDPLDRPGSREDQADNLRNLLISKGLTQEESEILTCKFAYDYTYQMLADDFGFSNPMTAWRYIKHMTERLRHKLVFEETR